MDIIQPETPAIPVSMTKEYKRKAQAAFREKHSDKIREKNKERYRKKKDSLKEMRDKLAFYESIHPGHIDTER
jgi:hypothetical protein